MKRRYIPHAQPIGPRPATPEMLAEMDAMTDEQLAKNRIWTFWMRCWVCHRVEWLRYLAPCSDIQKITQAKIDAGWTGAPVPNHPDRINFLRPKCPDCSTKETA